MQLIKDQIEDSITKLINHNGGWFTLGSEVPREIGLSLLIRSLSDVGVEQRATIVAEASYAEAKADCTYLGYSSVIKCNHWYKAVID